MNRLIISTISLHLLLLADLGQAAKSEARAYAFLKGKNLMVSSISGPAAQKIYSHLSDAREIEDGDGTLRIGEQIACIAYTVNKNKKYSCAFALNRQGSVEGFPEVK